MKKSIDLRLYRSQSSPCAYLPDQNEEQAYLLLDQHQMLPLADRLNRVGFRRSMNSVYMPACPGCQACHSVRIRARDFTFSRNQRKLLRRNADVQFFQEPLTSSYEKFDLFQRYLCARHPKSDMNDIDFFHFNQLVETAPDKAFALCGYSQDQLLAMMMVDHFSDGLSAVYSFYDTDSEAKRSLGILLVLELVALAQEYDLPYVYLGYYVAGSKTMAYKRRFRPMEVFDWSAMAWVEFGQECIDDTDETTIPMTQAPVPQPE